MRTTHACSSTIVLELNRKNLNAAQYNKSGNTVLCVPTTTGRKYVLVVPENIATCGHSVLDVLQKHGLALNNGSISHASYSYQVLVNKHSPLSSNNGVGGVSFIYTVSRNCIPTTDWSYAASTSCSRNVPTSFPSLPTTGN